MKYGILALILVALAAIEVGCSCDSSCPICLSPGTTTALPGGWCCGQDGVAYTGKERREMRRRVAEIDCRQLNDDLDYFFLQEQPSHLSRWPIE
ncbi:MAG TPA: hypothetical protein PKG54_14505 [Phycisphaerae bacterium]|jgi:hypothetical protein|nr:hypothetical protein [Phycisphaerae bacterium]HOB75726.1 hypothetical protein [Phycisphaerae bacterium]HOJ56425.1 hypothetical protein [Phycisphaerae bacterium]HOL28014.1 hypothetical protein [Phycisphaerae bacterium]HPP22399.1 hypothetical protein [Phycisphaerae bacterium]